jgi:hypothetical protein
VVRQSSGINACHNPGPDFVSNPIGEIKNTVRKSTLLALAGVFLLLAMAWLFFVVFQIPAAAQSGDFQIALNGKPVGTASYHFQGTLKGYTSTSMVRVSMKGLDYAFSKSERLSRASELQHVFLSAVVNNSAVTVSADPAGAQVLLKFSANGRGTANRLPAHKAAVFLPDFDPGALETLLVLAVEHNDRDLWAIIPKQEGSVAPVTLATLPDEQGTLDGKPVTVHHLVATIIGSKTDIFSGPDNQLLQAELPQEGFALVRKGFVLKPPARPLAPSAE